MVRKEKVLITFTVFFLSSTILGPAEMERDSGLAYVTSDSNPLNFDSLQSSGEEPRWEGENPLGEDLWTPVLVVGRVLGEQFNPFDSTW